MGATHQSVKGNAVQVADYNNARLDAVSSTEYDGLVHAFRLAVEAAITSNPAVQAAVAQEVQQRIITVHQAWLAAGGHGARNNPWPFKKP